MNRMILPPPVQPKDRAGREGYVDVGKGFAIIAIVCGHICFLSDYSGYLFSFWPVAFFFLVAGFYIKDEKLNDPKKFIWYKIKTIYIPGTFIYLIAILAHNFFVWLGAYPEGQLHPSTSVAFEYWSITFTCKNLVKTIVAPNGELAMGAMWFLYSLFFAFSFLSVVSTQLVILPRNI